MNDIVFVRAQDSVTPAQLEAIEQQYGFVLPTDYKQHLLRINGGYPKKRSFFKIDEDGIQREYQVNQFKAVQHGSATLERSLESLRDQLHPDLVPFANEAGGDQFCLSVGPEDYGSVYYVSHESYVPPFGKETYNEATDEYVDAPPPAPREYGEGVYYLAPSFTTFLDGLIASTPA